MSNVQEIFHFVTAPSMYLRKGPHVHHAPMRIRTAPPQLTATSAARDVDVSRVMQAINDAERNLQGVERARQNLDASVRSSGLITGREGFKTRRAVFIGVSSFAASEILFGSAPVLSAVRRIESGGEAGRDVVILSSGVQYSDLSKGSGEPLKTGSLVVAHVIGTLETGQVFLDTREVNVPIRWEWGITGPYIPEGLEEGLAGARAGGRRLIVVPAELGYGSSGIRLPQGTVPGGAVLQYDVEVLRCTRQPFGAACCSEKDFPCTLPQPVQ